MKYYIIAGEASGDLHASMLMQSLKNLDASADFRCWGGDRMREEGAFLVKHYKELAFMGFLEVLAHLGAILKNIRFCKNDIFSYQPDIVILVDYPGFNMRIASHVQTMGIPVAYYISPQVWAWKQSRVYKIRKYVDKMICVLPFEKKFYKKFDIEVEYVGHPLLDVIAQVSDQDESSVSDGKYVKPLIALVPGSREQEVRHMLPYMIETCRQLTDCRFVIAGVQTIPEQVYHEIKGDFTCEIKYGHTYQIYRQAHAAMITSGTASLEAALHKLPHVVCYKGNHLSYLIARMLVKVKYITITNLVLERQVIKELIQNNLHVDNLLPEMRKLIHDKEYRYDMIRAFDTLIAELGGSGASCRAARIIVDMKS